MRTPPDSARDRVLDSASRLFYRDGIRATGVDRIIAEAGVAKMSFYRNFPSKAELVAAWLRRRHAEWMGWFDEAVERRWQAGERDLGLVADVLAEWFEGGDFRGCAFLNTLVEQAGREGMETALARAHAADLEQALAMLAVRCGLAQPVRAAAAAMIVVEGLIVRVQSGAGVPPQVELARTLLQRLG